jgi:hypothetical protein
VLFVSTGWVVEPVVAKRHGAAVWDAVLKPSCRLRRRRTGSAAEDLRRGIPDVVVLVGTRFAKCCLR